MVDPSLIWIRLNIVSRQRLADASKRILEDFLANGPQATNLRGDELRSAIQVSVRRHHFACHRVAWTRPSPVIRSSPT